MAGVQRERGGGEDRWGKPSGDMSKIQDVILRNNMICALRKKIKLFWLKKWADSLGK